MWMISTIAFARSALDLRCILAFRFVRINMETLYTALISMMYTCLVSHLLDGNFVQPHSAQLKVLAELKSVSVSRDSEDRPLHLPHRTHLHFENQS
jgi:hypothetical protein